MKNAMTGGKIFYGIHFYPGVAEYQEEDGSSYRVFLNENTLRLMDPTFAGKPIFVEHVDEVAPDLNEVRKEADGWVIESFFNSSDGKHWVKFIVVSERGERAIKNGMRLSNAYMPKSFKDGGLWNGVSYAKEITDGEYEHLAIVKDPRYEESKILTPEEFKKYNEDKLVQLKKLSNEKSKGVKKMGFNFFKRTKVENAIDPDLQVVLPKSGKIVSVQTLIENADSSATKEKTTKNAEDDASGESAKHHAMANMDHMVKMHDGSYMKLKDVMAKHKDAMEEIEEMKKKKDDSVEKELDVKTEPADVDVEGDLHNDPDSEHDMSEHEMDVKKEEKKMELNDEMHPEEYVHDDAEDEDAKKKALQIAEHEDKEIEEAKKKDAKSKKKNDILKADALRKAHLKAYQNSEPESVIELPHDKVARGRERYGS